MNDLKENPIADSIPWFRRWFDSTYYHKLYAHRDEREAKNFIDKLISQLQPELTASIIDVGCGTGRHCRYLAEQGFQVTGIDLAFSNIREAKKSSGKSVHFYQHDMRLPFGNKSFDYVFNFFTSFGYFKNGSEHMKVIRNMSEALRPGGSVVLDFLNPEYAEKNLVASEQKEIDGIIYNITRWADEKHIYKKIAIDDSNMPGSFEHTEKVAKFSIDDFEEMFQANDLVIDKVFGDYHLNEYKQNHSPRLIMIAGSGC